MKFLLILVAVLFCFVKANEREFRKIDDITPEGPCSAEGGLCTVAEDCPTGQLSEKRGLCPEQRSQGIECCYGMSVKETRCGKRGGECRPPDFFCNPKIIFSEATDCPKNYHCCILV